MRVAIVALAIATAVALGSAAALATAAPGPTGGDLPAAVTAEKPEKPEQAPLALVVTAHRSKLLRTKADIYRAQVDDAAVCDVTQFTPRSLSVRGKQAGTTGITIWLHDGTHQPVRLLVRVIAAGSG